MKLRSVLLVLLLTTVATPAAAEIIRVVASTEDLAAIAREIGGDRVVVESIATGDRDPHFVELLPSYMIRVRKADVYLEVGMELDYWAGQIIDGSRNAKLVVVDCSLAVPAERRLEVPTRTDASQGDVHRYGNPHYWLDPRNGKLIAGAIADGLASASPADADAFRQGLRDFETRIDAKMEEWSKRAEPLRGLRIVTYHNSWPYFANAFGIEVVGQIEPKPGVKPSPSHVASLVRTIRSGGVALVAHEPYFEKRTPQLIARETGVPLVELPPSVGGVAGVTSYFDLFDYNLDAIARASNR